MEKFKLKENLEVLGKIILNRGEFVEFNQEGKLQIMSDFGQLSFNKSDLEDKIEKINQEELNFKISLLDDDIEDTPKMYRLQLDVKTTMRKVREIEDFLKKTIQEML